MFIIYLTSVANIIHYTELALRHQEVYANKRKILVILSDHIVTLIYCLNSLLVWMSKKMERKVVAKRFCWHFDCFFLFHLNIALCFPSQIINSSEGTHYNYPVSSYGFLPQHPSPCS